MREWLKNLRDDRKMSQQDMADKLVISLSYYNLIENGERQKDINLAIISKLSNALDVPIGVLITYEQEYKQTIA